MAGRHPSAFLPAVLYRRSRVDMSKNALVDHAGTPEQHWFFFEVYDIKGAHGLVLKDGFALDGQFIANGWTLALERDRRGWRDFQFTPATLPISEWNPRTMGGQAPADHNWNLPEMRGRIRPRSGKLEISEDELRKIGMPDYQFAFVPLLEYAKQFPPFVEER